MYQNKCVIPFQKHKKRLKKAIREVGVSPGQKLCYSCRKHDVPNLNTAKRTESTERSDNDCVESDASFNKDEAFSSLTSKVFLLVISNSFGKNTVNCIHLELIPVKTSAAKYL